MDWVDNLRYIIHYIVMLFAWNRCVWDYIKQSNFFNKCKCWIAGKKPSKWNIFVKDIKHWIEDTIYYIFYSVFYIICISNSLCMRIYQTFSLEADVGFWQKWIYFCLGGIKSRIQWNTYTNGAPETFPYRQPLIMWLYCKYTPSFCSYNIEPQLIWHFLWK